MPTPSAKTRGCFNCDHFQTYGNLNAYGECRAHPPLKCCGFMTPTLNNFPQIDQTNGPTDPGYWCDEWKRTTGQPAPYTRIP